MKYTVSIPRLNTEIETFGRITLLELLRQHDIPIGSSCAGEAICGWCKIRILNHPENLHPPTTDEKEYLACFPFNNNKRLACQIWIEFDLTIETDYW